MLVPGALPVPLRTLVYGSGRYSSALRIALAAAFFVPVGLCVVIVHLGGPIGANPANRVALFMVSDLRHASGVASMLLAQLSELDRRERQASERLAAIVDSSQDAIYTKALDGTVLTWNQAAAALYGYDADEIVGRPVTLLVPQDLARPSGSRSWSVWPTVTPHRLSTRSASAVTASASTCRWP